MATLKNVTQLGKTIQYVRKHQDLTQEQLAAMCGVGVRFIRELEHGKESCHIGKAMTVAQMLGLEIYLNGPDISVPDGDGRGNGAGAGADDGSGWG